MKKILIAEDNELNMKLMADVLEAKGYSVSQVCDGQAVLDIVEKEDFDLILLDIQMPVKSGYDVLKELKTDIPVLVVSACAMKEEVAKSKQFKNIGYITKPIQLDSFLSKVKSALKDETILNE